MKIKFLDWVRESLFIKIVLIFIFSFIVVFYAFDELNDFVFKSTHFKKIQRDMANYSSYILTDITTTPDTSKIKKVADKLGIGIYVNTSELTYLYPKSEKKVAPNKLIRYKGDSVRVGFYDGLRVNIKKGNSNFQFVLKKKGESVSYLSNLVFVLNILIVSLVLVVIYFVLRWILNPIPELDKGVKKLTHGDLDFKLQSKRKDELGSLVNSFNRMRRSIKNMIKAREQLLLDVSHELRSPITRINLSLEMMENSPEKKDISEDVSEMKTMITELLESARIQSEHGEINKKENFIPDLIRETVEKYKNQDPGVEIKNLEPVSLNVDRRLMKIMLKNILSNGLKYSDGDSEALEISMQQTQSEVSIQIQDHGEGIPEEDQKFIFEPFYRVDKSRSKETGGYGLGMSLSKKIIEAHNGEIKLKSELGKGTTIRIVFPANREN